MVRDWEDVSFVVNSQYRLDTVIQLGRDGPATPTEIADAHEHSQPHISRCLSELQANDLVELLVDEDQRRGRFYGLTAQGEAVWQMIQDRLDTPVWEFADPAGTPYEDIVSFLHRKLGDAFRVGGTIDQQDVKIYHIRDEVRNELTDGQIDQLLGDLLVENFRIQYPRIEELVGTLEYELKAFEEVHTLLVVVPDAESNLFLSYDPSEAVNPTAIARGCTERVADSGGGA